MDFTADDFANKIACFFSYINEITLKNSELNLEERRLKISETLKFDYFVHRLRLIFGPDLNESHCKTFFKKISHNPDCVIDWSELFGYNSDYVASSDSAGIQTLETKESVDEVQIFMAPFRFRIGDASGEKARRDIIQSIHYATDIDSFITVAQKGAVSIWNSKLKLNGCVFLKEQYDGWLNGCCFLPNIKRVAVAAERTLSLWDFKNNKQKSANNSMVLINIQGMSGLTCLDNINKINKQKDSDKIIIGDSFGNIITMEISLNELSSNNTKTDLFDPMRKIIEVDSVKNFIVKKKVHDEAVTKIQYIPELKSFISCSSSEKISLVIEELFKFEHKDIKINRQIGVTKGLNTFCYCSKVNLIATGGVDKVIRLYNPLVLSKSSGKLIGHLFTIVDLVSNEKDQQLISLSSERVFRVWDLTSFKCLQVFSDTEIRPGEKRISCICFDQKKDRLLTCSSVLDCWPLTRSVQDTMLPPHTHDRPIISIFYSQNQLATLCSDSVIKVWECDMGKLLYVIKEAHGHLIKVTCMAIDSSGFRLATAAIDGSLKIWNFATGQELKSKSAKKDRIESKIVSLNYGNLQNELLLFVCYSCNIIKIYQDSIDSNELNLIFCLGKMVGKEMPLNKYDLVPPIQSDEENSQYPSESDCGHPKLNNYEYSILAQHRIITSVFDSELNLLITASDCLVLWNTENQELKEIFGLDSNYSEEKIESLTNSSKIYCVKLLVNKKKKVDFKNVVVQFIETKSNKFDQNCEPEKDNFDIKSSYSRKSSTISLDQSANQKEIIQPKISFKYMILTGHENGSVQFWSENGDIINVVNSNNSIKSTPITCICIDPDKKKIYTADSSGYITIWSIDEFIESYNSTDPIDLNENSKKISMVICWRGHLNKIVGLIYIPHNKILYSASSDESVRAWCGNTGKYIGFLGQNKPIKTPDYESSEWMAPYDISEPPIYLNKAKFEKKSIEKNYEYPLVLNKQILTGKYTEPTKSKILPKMSSLNLKEKEKKSSVSPNEKYFEALVKPKHSFNESEVQVRSFCEGSIFSSLPLYQPLSISSDDLKTLVSSNPYRLNKEATILSNEKTKGPRVNFKNNVKIIK